MKMVFSYTSEYKKYIYSSITFLFFSVIFGVLPYIAISHIVVAFMSDKPINKSYILIISRIVFAAIALKSIAMVLGLSHSHMAAYGILYNIRRAKAKDMINHSLGDIMHNGVGKYKKGFTEDIDLLENLLAHMIPEGIPNIFIVIVTYVHIFTLDYRLGLLSLAIILAGLIPMAIMMKTGLVKMPTYFASLEKMNDTIIEYVGGMEVVKVFGKTGGSFEKLKNSVLAARDFTYGWYKVCWRDMSIMNAVLPCTVLFSLPFGVLLYQNGEISLSNFVTSLLLNLSLSVPLIKFMSFMPIFPQVSFAIKKMEDTFKAKEVVVGKITEAPENYDIKFENVDFSYANDVRVLENLNLHFNQGELTALVGKSGSGKSTIAKLIVHFWDVSEGSVRIGGVDIRDFTSQALMSLIAYVSQDTILFNGTIMENLLIGKENATKDDVINACKMSCCHDFIIQLEKGYDSEVGTLGGKLSGGEKQRITIARAMLKDAPIVILDEATAHTDAENEDLIQTALSNLLKGKTVIVIAHRLNTIQDAIKSLL